MTIIAYLLLVASLSPPQGQGLNNDERGVREVMAAFVTAFNNLDLSAFRECWVDNPVMFHPSVTANPTGKRIDEPGDFDRSWQLVFNGIREAAARRGVTQAPYQSIQPHDLRIDFPAPTVAVVSFHLGPNNNVLGRRMFVVVKTQKGWKISHLHASNLTLAPTQ